METVNQEQTTTTEQQKSFTQDELDKIVSERLGRERAKYGDYEALKEKAAAFDKLDEANKSELQKATDKAASLQSELDKLKKADKVREIREKVAKETGVPVNLLTAEDEETCNSQARAALDFAKPTYPSVKDGGEAATTGKEPTRDQFANWFNQNGG